MQRPTNGRAGFKIVLVGPHHSGKSTLVGRLAKDSFSVERMGSSVSLDFGSMEMGEHTVSLFGTPGKQDFLFMRDVLTRGADGCLLVVDATDLDSFPEAQHIYLGLREKGIPLVLAANKQDAPEALPPEEIRDLLDVGDTAIVGISATSGEGVEALLEALGAALEGRA